GCEIRSERSISLTNLSDDASRLRMARRLGSAIMAKADSTTGIYLFWYIPVKSCPDAAAMRPQMVFEIGGGRRDRVRDDLQGERCLIEGECVATLWKATFMLPGNKQAVMPIFDFFRVVDGEIKEIRPYFDPKPLKEAA